MQHIEDVYVVLLLALGYPVVYSIEAFYQPINTDAYANQIGRTNRNIRCTGFINLDLAARIYFWYLPVSVLAAHMILSRWKGQMTHALLWGLLAPHAFFYSVVLTVKCPPERTYKPCCSTRSHVGVFRFRMRIAIGDARNVTERGAW